MHRCSRMSCASVCLAYLVPALRRLTGPLPASIGNLSSLNKLARPHFQEI